MKQYIWIVLIVLLAGFLRFWHLTAVPPALNSDEVAIGYNAYSILKTGKDEYNVRYPMLFRSFDDYKMPVYVYIVAGCMKIFGYGDFAVRFPSALFGTLTVLFTYLLTQELFRKKNISLVASFLLAISPWSLQFSRAGYEANVAVFFIVSGVYLFLKQRYVFSAVLLSLSVWTYLTPRIFVPLLALGLAVIYRKELYNQKIKVFIAIMVAIILLLPIAKISLSREGQMRAGGVSAFSSPDDVARLVSRLKRDSGITLLFDNRRIMYAKIFLRGYFSHFDPTFLFLDKSVEKYRAPDIGLLYLFELPLVLTGLYMLVRRWSSGSALLIWWILISPVAAAFTLQYPHPVRTLVFLPTFQILSAVGFVTLLRKRTITYIIVAAMVLNVIYYFHQYYSNLPVEDAAYWYVGRREMTEKINAVKDKYDTVYVSSALDFPYIFYLYYSKYDPVRYQLQGGTVSGGFMEESNRVDNIRFRTVDTSLEDPGKKILFVGLPGEVFKRAQIVDTVYFPDGSQAIQFFR